MYRGNNQDYYIASEVLSNILNKHGRGKNVQGKDYIGERMYSGKNV